MISDNFYMAIASIRGNRLRSFLTMLGIIIGVVSVVTSVSLGEGVKRQISQETSRLGQDVVAIRPGKVLSHDTSGLISGINTLSHSSGAGSVLTEKDLESVRKIPDVDAATPLSLITGVPETQTESLKEAVVIGTTPSLPDMFQQKIEFGGFFNESESQNQERVAVIGAKVAEKLFREYTPLGKTFTWRGEEFIVRGVFEKFEASSLSQGIDMNYAIFIPYSTAKSISGGIQFYEILARIDNKENIESAVGMMSRYIKASHGGEEDFTILRANESVDANNNIVGLMTTMVTAIAGIAMIVGGVGIMNIMLVSVTERTREIGIRKAVGATDHQIRTQFLIEAVVLSVWGAAIGVVTSGLINLLLRITTELQPVIVWQVVVYATFVSILVGVLFGAAPAFKASRKDPIEALRS